MVAVAGSFVAAALSAVQVLVGRGRDLPSAPYHDDGDYFVDVDVDVVVDDDDDEKQGLLLQS